jgi:hypothetical protein
MKMESVELTEMQIRVYQKIQKKFYLFYAHANNYVPVFAIDAYLIPQVMEFGFIRKQLIDERCLKFNSSNANCLPNTQ